MNRHLCFPMLVARMAFTHSRRYVCVRLGAVRSKTAFTNEQKKQAVRSLGPVRSPVTRRPRLVYLPSGLLGILVSTCETGRVILGAASRLDAFSASPFAT